MRGPRPVAPPVVQSNSKMIYTLSFTNIKNKNKEILYSTEIEEGKNVPVSYQLIDARGTRNGSNHETYYNGQIFEATAKEGKIVLKEDEESKFGIYQKITQDMPLLPNQTIAYGNITLDYIYDKKAKKPYIYYSVAEKFIQKFQLAEERMKVGSSSKCDIVIGDLMDEHLIFITDFAKGEVKVRAMKDCYIRVNTKTTMLQFKMDLFIPPCIIFQLKDIEKKDAYTPDVIPKTLVPNGLSPQRGAAQASQAA
jgi:hypothetical protein